MRGRWKGGEAQAGREAEGFVEDAVVEFCAKGEERWRRSFGGGRMHGVKVGGGFCDGCVTGCGLGAPDCERPAYD